VWITLIALFGLGYGANLLWRHYLPVVAQHPQYRLTADNIHIPPPPPWIRSDIKSEALRDAGLLDSLSVLDDWDTTLRRVKDAFEFHPWVASVESISKRVPAALDVRLVYRRPIAAVETNDTSGITFLPIDEKAVRLPEGDFTEVERRYLPRIAGVTGRPLVGDAWVDSRVVGGARVAAALADIWQQLRLVEILAQLESGKPAESACSFEIVTSGGTRILWGAAPGLEATANESTVEEKRKRLLAYAAQHDHLDSIDGPAVLDIRTDVKVTPRTARRAPAEGHENRK
jgi:hypothetical protein